VPKVETQRRGRAFIVTINRPEVRNAVDGETAGLLLEVVEAFRRDETLDVLIITGAGELAFCSGADLRHSASLIRRPGAEKYGPMGISYITDLPKPAIAAINGYCLAGGLELACWCDFRIAARNASFGVLNRRWGVPLIDGGTQRLPRIVGLGQALQHRPGPLLHPGGQAAPGDKVLKFRQVMGPALFRGLHRHPGPLDRALAGRAGGKLIGRQGHFGQLGLQGLQGEAGIQQVPQEHIPTGPPNDLEIAYPHRSPRGQPFERFKFLSHPVVCMSFSGS